MAMVRVRADVGNLVLIATGSCLVAISTLLLLAVATLALIRFWRRRHASQQQAAVDSSDAPNSDFSTRAINTNAFIRLCTLLVSVDLLGFCVFFPLVAVQCDMVSVSPHMPCPQHRVQ
jgi:Na+/H+ antiporter NhaD/arsenite permease-like protein